MEKGCRIEVWDSEVSRWAVREPVPCAALGVCPWQGNPGEGLVLSWAAGWGDVCVVPATEGLETGLEPPTMVSSCPGGTRDLSSALGSGGQRGLWGSSFWGDGHHFRQSTAEQLQVVAAALQKTQYQHLLSLHSVLLGAAVFKEF